MGYFDNLNLDTWYKAVTYLGGIFALLSITIQVQVVSNEFIAMIGFGMFLYGVGRWKNTKTATQFVPGGKLSQKQRIPDLIGYFLEILGAALILLAVGYTLGIDFPSL
jgi:hypothetical protein